MEPSSHERESPTGAKNGKPKYRFITSNSTGKLDDPAARIAIRRHVMTGLRKTKRHFDPNEVEILVPPSLLTSPPSRNETTNPAYEVSGAGYGSLAHFQLGIPKECSSNDQNAGILESRHGEVDSQIAIKVIPFTSTLGIDPFANCPIRMKWGEKWLMHLGKMIRE